MPSIIRLTLFRLIRNNALSCQVHLIDRSVTVCLHIQHAPRLVSTLLEADVGPFEVLNVRQVLELCLKSEVTLKVYFKQTVAMTIMKVYFRRAKCDHGLCFFSIFKVLGLNLNRKQRGTSNFSPKGLLSTSFCPILS